MSDALISIKPVHVKNILNGCKSVELRTRRISVAAGSRLWIYSTLPKGEVEAVAEVRFVETNSPSTIWRKYSKDIYLSKAEFDEYTTGKSEATVIGLGSVEKIEKELTLKRLRFFDKKFTPPQFFLKLTPDKKIYPAFSW